MKLSAYQKVQKLKNDYDEIGLAFSETRKKRMWPEIFPFIKMVKKGMKVLDVGCGNGRLIPEFRNKEIDYLGTDFSEVLLSFAKERFPNKKFLLRDITKVKDWDRLGKFDVIFCLGVMHHIPDRKLQHLVFQQMYQHLNQNGFLVLSVWNLWQSKFLKNHLLQIFEKIENGNLSYIWMPFSVSDGEKRIKTVQRFCKAYLPGELISLVKQAGLSVDKYYFASETNIHMSILSGRNFVLMARKK